MIRVSEIMTGAVVKLRTDSTLKDATRLMSQMGVSGVPVVDEEDNLVGILCESDILEYAARKVGEELEVRSLSCIDLPYDRIVRDEELCRQYQGLGESMVEDAMNEEVITIDLHEPVEKALETMVRFHINHIPVTETGKLVGIIARQDVLIALCKEISSRKVPP